MAGPTTSAFEAGTTPLPPIADLPSGSPIPTIPSAPSKPAPLPIGALLAAAPSNIDAFLTRLNKCLSTPTGIDTVMLFLCYTSRFSSTILETLSRSLLRRSATEWLTLLTALPPRTTILFSTSASKLPSTATAAAALVLARRLKALSTLLSEARTILRLWALLPLYFWGKGLISGILSRRAPSSSSSRKVTTPQETPLETALSATRLALCVGLQALENGAYLSSKGVMGWTPAQQGLAYKWSARFWAAYVGVELGRLLAEGFGPSTKGKGKADEGETLEWRKKVARNAAWMPLTIHWSTDKGVVSEPWIGALASIPGIIAIRDLWASTA